MHPLRIAIISPEFPPLTNWGGFATFNQQLFNLLTLMGHDVHVLAYDGNGDGKKQNPQSKQIHYVPFRTRHKIVNWMYFRFPFGIFRNIFMRYFPCVAFAVEWNIFALLFFVRLNKIHKFQIIHTPTPALPAWLIKKMYPNIPLVIHEQGLQSVFNSFETKTLDLRVRARLENAYIQSVGDRIVACSQFENEILRQAVPHASNKTIVINNFINLPIPRSKTSVNIYNLVYLGRLEYRKGVDIIVKSFITLAEANKHVSLFLIGNDSGCFDVKGKKITLQTWMSRQSIPSYISKRIHYISQIDNRDSLFKLLNKLRGIGVVPARYEPFGFTALELMALGYLVIASRESGSRDIITDTVNGFLIKPERNGLIQCVRHVQLLSANAREQISQAAKCRATTRYGYTAVKKHYQTLYKEILNYE